MKSTKQPIFEVSNEEVEIRLGNNIFYGYLTVPEKSKSIVIFSHGSGSSRKSPRNNYVAGILSKNNIATLLTDLLTPEEDSHYGTRFDIDLLTSRLVGITNWTKAQASLTNFSTGYFGASTGAASALKATAQLKNQINAVVSRGGRPDLAGNALSRVLAPALLLVGTLDTEVLQLNEAAYHILACEKKLQIIDGATHLFEEPGKLEEVANLAYQWFHKYLNLN